MQEKCCVRKCNKPIKVKKHKLCGAHYARYLRKFDVEIDSTPIRAKKYHTPYGELKAASK